MSSFVHNSTGLAAVAATPVTVTMMIEGAIKHLLEDFPNDLARLIYMATLRDCNTGTYLHPELSQLHPSDVVTENFRRYHEQVFRGLLRLSVRSYVDEVRLYIAYSRVTAEELITTWKDLGAYRSAIPLKADRIEADLFNLNVSSALLILESRSPGARDLRRRNLPSG
jgi:hypothetical protein